MGRASDEGTLIGILDINGIEIANGDVIRVAHVIYPGTHQESIEEEFIAKVFYNSRKAAFLYAKGKDGPKSEELTDARYFDTTIQRYEILEDK